VPFTYEFPRPSVTVDAVLFALRAGDLAVLLVRRKKAPFKDCWALPGGFVDEQEPLEKAAARELAEETGVTGVALEQLGAFGDPGRDPRGHTVSVAYVAFTVAETHPVKAGDDAADAEYVPMRELDLGESGGGGSGGRRRRGARRKLAFDHATIVLLARDRLRERMNEPVRKNAFELVPPRFTLSELQRVYEAVFGRTLDKRNFRAKVIARGLVEPVSAARREGRHRPAQLYRWKRPKARRR
jgi:8-oxo-dGTP diphosphatase